MIVARQILLAALAALLAITSVAAAETRGQMAEDGVICGTGTYAVVIAADGLPLFGGNGAPVEYGTLPCLDCTFAKFGLVPADAMLGHPVNTTSKLTIPSALPKTRFLWIMGGHGRGPPGIA